MAVSELSLRIRVGLEDFELNADLALPGKGVSVIFGPSGSGKTTLLRAIAGLQISEGEIWFNGDCWQGSGEHRKTSERPLAYVFQEASLFPHMTVAANFDFAERYALHADTPSLRDDLITLLDIRHTLSRKPDRLSGGERQRAAIVRAFDFNCTVKTVRTEKMSDYCVAYYKLSSRIRSCRVTKRNSSTIAISRDIFIECDQILHESVLQYAKLIQCHPLQRRYR